MSLPVTHHYKPQRCLQLTQKAILQQLFWQHISLLWIQTWIPASIPEIPQWQCTLSTVHSPNSTIRLGKYQHDQTNNKTPLACCQGQYPCSNM